MLFINAILAANLNPLIMTKIKFGAIVTDGRGKLGGHVLTKNRQGAAMRTKSSPVQRRTNSQQASKNRFTTLTQAWRVLTEAQRLAWNSAAPDYIQTNIFGDTYAPTGKNLFMLLNETLLIGGFAMISAPVLAVSPVPITAFAVASNTSAAQTLSFAPTPIAADNFFIVEATRPLSAGKYAPGSAFRILSIRAAADISPLNTFAEYQSLFGTPVTGKKIFFRVTAANSDTGIRGIPLQASSITA